jgi:hypothetical protein
MCEMVLRISKKVRDGMYLDTTKLELFKQADPFFHVTRE